METDQPIILYGKDVQQITGRSRTHASRLLQKARTALGKEKNDPVSVLDFCKVYKLQAEEVYRSLKRNG